MKWVIFLAAILASPAFAQQQPDAAILQRLIAKLEQQRNEAMYSAAQAESKANQLAEEVQRLKAEIAARDAKPKE